MSTPPLREPRLTHVALPCSDLDATIDFYEALTPLVVVARHQDDQGRSAWLSNAGQATDPFVVVLVEFFGQEPGRSLATLGPFSHLGIELPDRADVDAVAEVARERGCLHWEPRQLAEHVGYVCAVTDPDGNVVEFSHGQRVFATVRDLWG